MKLNKEEIILLHFSVSKLLGDLKELKCLSNLAKEQLLELQKKLLVKIKV